MKKRIGMFLSVGLVLIMAISYFGVTSCSHCPPPPAPDSFFVSNESKNAGQFLEGTYWVYQNDFTLQTDSVAIISSGCGFVEDFSEYEDCGHVTNAWHQQCNSILSPNSEGVSFKYDVSSGVWFWDLTNAHEYFIYADSTTRSVTDTLYDVIDTMILNGTTFCGVYKRKELGTKWDHFTSANTYCSANIGLIKMEIFDSTGVMIQSSSLLRYHIVQ